MAKDICEESSPQACSAIEANQWLENKKLRSSEGRSFVMRHMGDDQAPLVVGASARYRRRGRVEHYSAPADHPGGLSMMERKRGSIASPAVNSIHPGGGGGIIRLGSRADSASNRNHARSV